MDRPDIRLGVVTIDCARGADESPEQYSERWHVMLDPAGHPFCLCLVSDS